MSKTYQLPVKAMAQGMVPGFVDISGGFTIGQASYTNAQDFPVAIQFASLPDALTDITPDTANLHIYCGAPGGKTVSSTYTSDYIYSPSVGEYGPTDQEIIETAGKMAKDRDRGVRIYPAPNKINISDAHVSLVVVTSRYADLYVNGSTAFGSIQRMKNPSTGYEWDYIWKVKGTTTYAGYAKQSTISSDRLAYYNAIENGVVLHAPVNDVIIFFPTDATPGYLEVVYDEGREVAYAQSPSGYIKPGESTAFSWRTTWSGFPIEDIQQTSATLEWKNGESGSINSVVISGNATAYTMPANTLPESQNLFWRIKTATAEGEIISNWQKFQTVDSTPEVTALSPSGTYADGTKAIRLVWSYAVETGTAQTAYDTQYKTASGDWADLQSESTGNAYADIPEGTLPAGNIQWRVRAYNQDGIASEWSNALTMVVISSPAAPQVRITAATPRPEIAWTSIDQQAYQVVIGSYDSGLQFGTAKSFKCPEYLADGQTRARVRIMNAYSLWSEYGSTDFEIENTTPAAAPVLSGSGGVNANLRWTGAEGASGYLVYRAGKKIAEVTGDEYTDRYAIGQKSYFVRAIFPGTDFYADSNTVQIVSVSETPVICDMDGGEWIPLRYSTTVLPATQINAQQEISLMHYSGSQYPTPEISSFRQRTYTINTAFQDMGMAYRFEELIGKKTCLKDQYQNLIIGILTSTTRMQSKLFTAYTAVINQIEE